MIKINKVVITGPTGAVGVALINEFISKNVEIYAICRVNSKRINNIPKHRLVHIIECNMNQYKSLVSVLPHDIDVFYHFAWDGTYGESRNNPLVQTKNIEYSMDSVFLAKELNCKVYVGAGSQSEYGHSNEVKGPTDYCFPDNFYGAAKLSTSHMTRVYCSQLGIKHIWCRIFSLFGPYDGEYTMIMSSIKKMLNNEDCKFTAGDQIWDYIYSKDAAKAFRLVAEKGIDGSVYCIASGQTRPLKEYIKSMHKLVNINCKILLGAIPYYEHQAMNLTADISNLKSDTGFEPKYTFEEGIKDLVGLIKNEDN